VAQYQGKCGKFPVKRKEENADETCWAELVFVTREKV
jgi:hypothetical protein